MKRPFVIIGIFALIISNLALTCKTNVLIIFSAFLAVAVIFIAVFFRRSISIGYIVILVVSVVMLCTSSISTIKSAYTPVSNLDDSAARVAATVVTEPYSFDGNTLYTFETSHPKSNVRFRFSAYSNELELGIGGQANIDVVFSQTEGAYKNHNLSNGIFVFARIENILSKHENASKFYSSLGNIRLYIKNLISDSCRGDTAGMLIALLTGDRTFISDSLYEASKSCGVTHILVVSGLHISILSGILSNIFNKLKLKPRLSAVILFAFFMLLIAICNFHPSAIRSVCMSALMLFGSLIHRKGDSLNSLGFAITVMVLFNPFIIGNIAFQLSLAATFGVIFLAPMVIHLIKLPNIQGKFSYLLSYVIQLTVVSLSALICAFPISVSAFGYSSLLSPLVGLFIDKPVWFALASSVLGIFLSMLPFFRLLSRPILYLSGLVADFIGYIIKFFGSSKFFIVIINPEQIPFCYILTAGIIITVWTLYKIKQRKGRSENAD